MKKATPFNHLQRFVLVGFLAWAPPMYGRGGHGGHGGHRGGHSGHAARSGAAHVKGGHHVARARHGGRAFQAGVHIRAGRGVLYSPRISRGWPVLCRSRI